MKKHLWILTGLVALAGCNPGGDTSYQPKAAPKVETAALTPGQEADLFPLKVGNKWRYEAVRIVMVSNGQQQKVSEETTMEVKEVTEIPEGKRAVIELSKKDIVNDRQIWEVRKDGIYQVSVGLEKPFTFAPAQKVFAFPVEGNGEWTYTGTGPTPFGVGGTVTSNSVLTGPEEVDTKTDRVSAFRVETKNSYKATTPEGAREGEEETQAFWSPGIGLVRFRTSLGAMIDTPANEKGEKGKLGVGSQTTLTLISRTLN